MPALSFDDLGSTEPLSEDEAAGALNLAAGGVPVTVTSTYRTPEHNAEIGGAPNSLHTRGGGQAADFVLPPGKDPAEVRAELERQGYPVSEWLIEKKGDLHSTGDHIHWGWGPKGQPAAQPAASGPVNFSDLDGGPAPAKGPVSFDDLDVQQPSGTWASGISAALRTTPDRWKQLAAGALQGAAETPAEFMPRNPNLMEFHPDPYEGFTPAQKAQDLKDRQAISRWSTQVYSDAQKHIQEVAPDMPPGSAKQLAYQVTSGVIDLAPIVAAGAVTKGVTVPAMLMGGSAAAQTYGAARAAGRSPDQARMDGLFSGMVNGALGTVPIGILMKPGQSFLGKTLQSAGAFGAFSVVTEALQIGYDKGLVDPKMTLAQAMERLKDAGITGTLTGGFLGGGHAGLEAAVGRYRATAPQKPVQPRVEPTVQTPAAAPGPPPRPRAAPKRQDLLASVAMAEAGPPPAPAAAEQPVPAPEPAAPAPEPIRATGELPETFRTGPAQIRAEHEREIAQIGAEATAAAAEKHTPEVLKPGYTPPSPEEQRRLDAEAVPHPPPGLAIAGQSADGRMLYEDKNGVRSYIEDGVRVTEPVQMRPTRGGVQMIVDRGAHPEFSTPEEVKEVPPSLPEAVQPPAPPQNPRTIELADRVADHLKGSDPLTAKALQATAEQVYGGTLASGAIPRDELYDAVEFGVNRLLRSSPSVAGHGPYSPVVDEANAMARAGHIAEIKNRLPTQTVRAGEKESHQQFSTPPDYSYAATWVANLHPSDVVLEPSAGTGSFVVHALNAGVREVHANEISDRRADLLRALGPTNVTAENAEHIDALLPEGVKPTVVLMNPPFSQTAGRMGNRKVIETGAKHLEAALKRLAPGGRLVAIVGDGMKPSAPTFRAFWERIGRHNDIRANIGIEGKIYRKYGTTFPTRLIVIDKVPPSGRKPIVVEGVKDAAGIIRALKEVHADRAVRSAGEQPPAEPTREGVAGEGARAVEPGAAVPDTAGVLGSRKGSRAPKRPGGAGRSAGAGERALGGPGERRPRAGADLSLAAVEPERATGGGANLHLGEPVAGGEEPLGSGGGGAGDGIEPDGSGQRAEPGVTEAPAVVRATEASLVSPTSEAPLTDAVYEPYTPQRVKVEGAPAHPGPLVQSAAMASVLPPSPRHEIAIPASLIKKGVLSDAQLEAVVYAGHAHAEILPPQGAPNETTYLPARRRGFFIGDGTGVGKGREVSGIMLDNWAHGRKQHIWVSEKKTLINDARRDWAGVGQDPKLIVDHGSVKAGEAIKGKRGILFTTYDTLKSAEQIGKGAERQRGKTRVQQIIDWAGPDFEGVIAFDEAHNLGNSFDMKANRGMKKVAAKALAGVELQNRLPNARVVYVSATGATEVNNLAYADRLGLWGRGTAFADRNDFLTKVASGGVAAMELVARDMKALGRYIARNLSYEGVEYDRVQHTLSPQQREVYDKLADAWQLVLRNFNAAMEAAGISEAKAEGGGSKTKNAAAKSAILSQFWGGHQRFFNQVITSMQMPTVLKAVEKDIAEGRQAVLQLVNTNEAAQERALSKVRAEGEPEAIEDLDMSPRDQLLQLVANAYPTQRFEDYVDENGNLRSRPVLDKKGNPVRDPALVRAREALLDQLGAIRVPDGPLEMLLNHFSPDQVAEVTGRKQRVVRVPDQKGQMRTVVQKRPASSNIAEANLFQEAKKPILVFSEAGGTGRSYHADISTASAGKRRSHYLVQAGWRADKAVQGFGRTHRTAQASAPIFRLVTTDLQGQKRFVSSIARRLGQLGALTKGERRTGNQGLFGLRDNLEGDEAKAALKVFYADALADRIPGIGADELQNQMGLKLIEPTTGRVLQDLPPMTQFLNRLLSLKIDLQNRVFDEFSKRMDDAIDRAAAAGTLDAGVETFKADKITKLADQIVYTDKDSGAETRHVHLVSSTRNKPAPFEQVRDRLIRVNESKEAPFVRSVRSGKVFGVGDATPYTSKEGHIIEQKRLIGPLDVQFLDSNRLNDRRYWAPVEDADAEGMWKQQVAKIPEFATEDLHLITGAVLPIWDRLAGSPKIFRLQTDAGERMLGRVIPSDSVNETLERLGASKLTVQAAPADIAHAVLDDGKRATLANGWSIKRSTVAGEPRLELVGPDMAFMSQLRQDGVFTERIDWKTRFFIPTGDEATNVIARVIADRPVTQLAKAIGGEDEPSQAQRASKTEDASAARREARPAIEPRPGLTRLANDVVAELPQAPSPQEQAVIDHVTALARTIVPKTQVVATRKLFAEGALAQGGARGIGGATTRGARRLIAWSLESPDAIGTLRHEAIHWLRAAGLIRPEEWGALERSARAGDWIGQHNIHERYPDLSFEPKIEEAVAEQFAGWRRAPQAVPRVLRPIFEKIATFIGQVRDYLRQAFGHDAAADNVFGRILSGEVGARTPAPPAPRTAFGKRATGESSVFQTMEPEERSGPIAALDRAIGVVGDRIGGGLASVLDRMPDSVHDLAEAAKLGVTPMAAGNEKYRAWAMDFITTLRAVNHKAASLDEWLKTEFTPAQQERMYDAQDYEGVQKRKGEPIDPAKGLASLTDDERSAVEEIARQNQGAAALAQKYDMLPMPLENYVPRMGVLMFGGQATRLRGGGAQRTGRVGRNLTTTTPQLKQRKHLELSQTEEALQAKFGEGAKIVRNIRTLNLATRNLVHAIAGRQLMERLRKDGQSVGTDTVVEGGNPDRSAYFTQDGHPAFVAWRPEFVEQDGKVVPRRDTDGKIVFRPHQMFVSRAAEGPLKAVLSQDSGAWARALNTLKAKQMSVIMFSPFMHNQVIWGRAFPAAPLRLLTPVIYKSADGWHYGIKLYVDGHRARTDPARMDFMIQHGMDPIGHRYFSQDVTAIANNAADQIEPGRSWTAQAISGIPGFFDPKAGIAVRRAIDKAGDIWHNKMLWDRVADLQAGLFEVVQKAAMRHGLDEDTAGWAAGHIANRYAGALPIEAMSKTARNFANWLLFSRSFTVGTAAAFKDAVAGLPRGVQSKILETSGPRALTQAQGLMRRKATTLIVGDILANQIALVTGAAAIAGLRYALTGLWQYDAPSKNEPGKENRVLAGFRPDGTAVYVRFPVGKTGEDLGDWSTEPREVLLRKLSPQARVLLSVASNDKGFGRKLFNENDKSLRGHWDAAASIAGLIAESWFPAGEGGAVNDLVSGRGDQPTNELRTVAPLLGYTISQGYPGGPQGGVVARAKEAYEFRVQQAMPSIRTQITTGDLRGARAAMRGLGMDPRYQSWVIRTTRNPRLRLSPHALRDFSRYATPDEREQMQRLRGANQ